MSDSDGGAEIIDNVSFNRARGKKMFHQGLPEPEKDVNSDIKLAVWSGYSSARAAQRRAELKRARECNYDPLLVDYPDEETAVVYVDEDNDLYRYPCDED